MDYLERKHAVMLILSSGTVINDLTGPGGMSHLGLAISEET